MSGYTACSVIGMDYHTANDTLSHGRVSSKTKTYHVTRSKSMKRQNVCKGVIISIIYNDLRNIFKYIIDIIDYI